MASTIYKYALTGATKFPVNFEYLARRFVKVTLIGVTVRELTLNIDFRFTSKNEIETTQVWTTGEFDTIEIRRVTSATDRLVNFSDGSILRAYDLNIAQIQAIHIAEEGRDVSDSALLNNGVKWHALGLSIGNLKDPIEPQDAATKRYVDSVSERDSAFNQNQLGRTVRAPQGEQVSQMPSAAQRAGKILGFDSSGNPIGMLPASGTGTELALDLIDKDRGAEMVEWTRKPLVDAVSTVSRMLGSQKVSIWEYQHLVASKPSMNPDTWDWGPAHLAAVAECRKTPNKALSYPGGKYPTSVTIDFGSIAVEGSGTDANTGTEIRALTDGMLLAITGSGCFLTNIKFNGRNLAIWNVLVKGNRPIFIKVESTYAKEFGYVFSATQNGSFYSIVSYFCLYSFGLFNGTRNCVFTSCGSATSSGPSGQRDPRQAEIVCDFDTSNPHGFGLGTSITTNGNDRNFFFAGIYEYPNTIIRMKNTANTNKDVGRLFFYGTEFAAGSGLILDTSELPAVSNPRLIFNNCEFTWKDQVTPFSKGTRGTLTFQGHASFSGGAQIANRGISQVNNLDTQGIREQDGTIYIDDDLNVTTIPKNGWYRPSTTGVIVNPVSFGTGHKEVWFSTKEGAAFVGGTNYRTNKGKLGEILEAPLVGGLSKSEAYTPSGSTSLPAGLAMLAENIGNGANDAAFLGFRTRTLGSNMYGYIGVSSTGLVMGSRVASGGGYKERLKIDRNGNILPGEDAAQNMGSASLRIGTYFGATGSISTSDGRMKEDVRDLSEAERRVALSIKGMIRAFRFSESIAEKDTGARIHFGVIAQSVGEAFKSEGLDPHEYALFCFDEWDDVYETVYESKPTVDDEGNPVVDDEGKQLFSEVPTGEKRLVTKGGDRYGIRYEELAMFIISVM